MKKFYLIGFLFCVIAGKTQNIARTIDYFPAPGQHINLEQTGTREAAQKISENENSLVSLGAFGGYVVLKFDAPCENNSENPYGIDFTVFGNAFSGSSEPGIIWIMKDENQNGEADDTWYEIAGSHHFYSKTDRNYGVTYFKTSTRNVEWTDKYGVSGIVKANSQNTQEYYPVPAYFPDYPGDSVSFAGTRLHTVINDENPMHLSVPSLDFGYADNHPKKQGVSLTVPDNPYSAETEGAGGDPVDISWAVNSAGSYVDLDEITFVKIATGYLADLGRLGEVSTDVSYVVDVEPGESVSENENLLVVYHPPTKVLLGNSVNLEAGYFEKGRFTETEISFSSSDSEIIQVVENNKLFAKNTGISEITATTKNEIKSFEIEVVEPDSIYVATDFSSVYPGDSVLLNAHVFDNTGSLLKIQPRISLSNSVAGKLGQVDNRFYFIAGQPGEVQISFNVEGFELEKTVEFKVLSESDQIKVYFTAKTESENLFPLQSISVGLADINEFVENRQHDYSGLNRPTLAHAIRAGLQKSNVNFIFRDDENSGGQLYLYSAETDGIFIYGWGGKTEPQAFARGWIAKVNGNQFIHAFDEVGISDGDTIFLYHISDINSSWKLSRLLANKDSAVIGETIELVAEEATCVFENGVISESELLPLKNQEVYNSESYFTDESGQVEIVLDGHAPWFFYSGNDAVLIQQKTTTGAFEKEHSGLKVFPNPVKKELNIEGEIISGADISIFNVTGKVIYQKTANSENVSFDLEGLNKGVYLLRIENKTTVKTIKFIKE